MTPITTSSATTASIATAEASATVRLACAFAFFLGAGLVFAVGFSHSEEVHNAAHDTRHSLAFPCH